MQKVDQQNAVIELSLRNEVGTSIKKMKREEPGIVPGTLYGPAIKPMNVWASKEEFKSLLSHSEASVIEVNLDSKKYKCIVKDISINALSDKAESFSLQALSDDSIVNLSIALKFIGESAAVKNNLGFLVTPIVHIPVRCLPKDIPQSYVVNISTLQGVGDSLFVKDIELGENVELKPGFDKYSLVATVVPPQKEVREETTQTTSTETSGDDKAGAEKTDTTNDDKE